VRIVSDIVAKGNVLLRVLLFYALNKILQIAHNSLLISTKLIKKTRGKFSGIFKGMLFRVSGRSEWESTFMLCFPVSKTQNLSAVLQ